MQIPSLHRIPAFLALLVLSALLSASLSLRAAMLLKQDFEGSNPWGGMAACFTADGGMVTATGNYSTVGMIDTYQGSTASSGVQLTVDSSAATGRWTAGIKSGVLPLTATTNRGLGFIQTGVR